MTRIVTTQESAKPKDYAERMDAQSGLWSGDWPFDAV